MRFLYRLALMLVAIGCLTAPSFAGGETTEAAARTAVLSFKKHEPVEIKVGQSRIEEQAWRIGYCLFITKEVTDMTEADVQKIIEKLAKEGTKSFSNSEWCWQ